MSIILQRIRLTVTTGSGKNDGTDDPVVLDFNVSNHPSSSYNRTGWQRVSLDNPGNDREPGQTDLYDVNFTTTTSYSGLIEGAGVEVSTTVNIPEGMAFDSFEKVREMPFFLIIRGSDLWRISHYHLMGYFRESWFPPNTIDSNATYNHGWLLMATHDTAIALSKDSGEAPRPFHLITINAVFPPEQESTDFVLWQPFVRRDRDARFAHRREMAMREMAK